jgi:alkylation response protein AidB-like acyl-CoA dehydrogenase
MATDEAEAIYDPQSVTVSAIRKDDGYVIKGAKMFVQYAHIADYALVLARAQGAGGTDEEIGLFIVDPKSAGVRLSPMKTIAADKQFQVDFEDVAVAPNGLVGDLHDALPLVGAVLEKATALQCAEMVGGAQQELDMTSEYTKTRMQFDRPVGTFQAVQHRLADMYIDVQAARWTTYQAAWRLSEGLPSAREVSLAKYVTSNACQRVAFSAQQLHGGIGVDLDYDLHYYYRRQKAFELRYGTASDHLKVLEAAL